MLSMQQYPNVLVHYQTFYSAGGGVMWRKRGRGFEVTGIAVAIPRHSGGTRAWRLPHGSPVKSGRK
jgi:hypothetical protein